MRYEARSGQYCLMCIHLSFECGDIQCSSDRCFHMMIPFLTLAELLHNCGIMSLYDFMCEMDSEI